ncbi:MAG: OmpH family outer membrane protein [Kiritimatiellales bacterium]
MKKLLLAGILSIAGLAGAMERMVFVNLEEVFNNFYRTQLSKATIEAQQKEIEAERKARADEITSFATEVDALKKEARDMTLTEDIRDAKRLIYEERLLELRSKQKELEEFVQLRQQLLQQQVTRMSQSIMDEIRGAVIEYAKRNGLQAVMDNSARRAAIGVFIYTHPDVDITQQILGELNSKRPDSFEQMIKDATGAEEAPVPAEAAPAN